jgi:class 3 adenylate cyclase/tetratricopeptide (TPR) repeat protein
MKCPKCQFDNRERAKFCGECGHKFEIICPSCGTNNPAGNKFCDECGFKISQPVQHIPKDLSLDAKIAKIQKYLPEGLTEKILAQKDRIEGERKQVTVMFCDMEGFTPLSNLLGIEEAYSVMDQVYEILIHKVHDYGGTVNEMTGDGIMALFGAPIALEDAAQRAIRTSLAIHREMAKFSDQLKHNKINIPPIKMRIGIHTGPVVVGTVGNDLRVEFKAVGDTVILASRMEGIAEPGSTYVTGDTFKLTEGLFRFEALGEKEVKGREDLIPVYRAIATSTSRTRFDVSAERGLTPVVGRERELSILLDGLEQAKKGRGQAISIMAEAGIGKSRLLYEFRKAVSSEDVTFLEGKCLSYSREVAYHLHRDILKANFDIREDDGDSEIREKVKKGLQILGVDVSLELPYFLELLSVKDSGLNKIAMSPEARKNRIMEAFKQIVLKGSEIRPLILAYEDLHWVDKSSESVLKYVLECIPGARVLLIFTYRPDFIHTWGAKSYHNQITLNRLSNRQSLMMVYHLLRSEELDSDLEEFILEKTEGIPFYIEELIKSLKDLKIVEKEDIRFHITKDIREVAVPTTIQDLIMARIDSLLEEIKSLLQTASAIGREFGHYLIQKVTGFAEQELLSHLSVLKDSELIYERGIYPQSTYIFKHALTQDVAYNSMLQKRRTELHRKIGQTMENIYADRLDEHCEMLSYHFLQGEDWQRAYRYSQEAGLKAYSHSAYDQAQRYFEESLTAIKKLPRQKNWIEREIDLRFHMRSPLVALGRHEEWGEWIRGAEPLAREINDNDQLSIVLNYLSSLNWILGRHRNAIELGEKALSFAQRAEHFSNRIATMTHLGMFYFTIGDYTKQIEIHQKVREQLTGEDAFKRHGLASLPGVLSRSILALGMAELGDFNKIEEVGHEALEIAEKVRNTFSLIFAYNFLAMAYLRLGKLEPALPLLEKGHETCRFSEAQSMYSCTVGSLSYAYLLAKEPRRALAVLQEGVKEESLQASLWPTHPLTVLADAYRAAGEISLATEAATRALRLSDKREERGFEAWAMLVMAAIHADADRIVEAISWYGRTLQQASDLFMRPLVAHCHKGLAGSYSRLGNEKEAQLENEKALEMYRSLGMRYWLQSA